MPNVPRVSIGMPVYNASATLPRAINSVLAQDFEDYELIICDNASTDDTYAICEAYAAADTRIRVYRNSVNLGAVANFTRVYELATGHYFMWLAHDDWLEPEFITACLAALAARPEAVMCYTPAYHHYTNSGAVQLPPAAAEMNNPTPWQRCHQFLMQPSTNTFFYGLYRRDAIAAGLPFHIIEAADTIFLTRLLYEGTFIRVDQPLLHYTVARRGGRIRVRQLAPGQPALIAAFRLDYRLWQQLRLIVLDLGPDEAARAQLHQAAKAYFRFVTGWPFSAKLLMRYTYVILPDWFIPHMLRWFERHPRIDALLRRVIGIGKAPSADESMLPPAAPGT